jgi:hypothetical protein
MLTARIEFKPGQGQHFCFGAKQDVIEMKFEAPEELMAFLREFEESIYNCTAQVGGKILDLREVSGLDDPAKIG